MPRLNRRLGERRPVEATEIAWNIPPAGWRQRLRPRDPAVGLIKDVSVTGAAIVAPADPSLHRGSIVPLAFGWIEGTVTVMRVDPSPDPKRLIYGVEFDRTDSPLAKAIHHAFLPKTS